VLINLRLYIYNYFTGSIQSFCRPTECKYEYKIHILPIMTHLSLYYIILYYIISDPYGLFILYYCVSIHIITMQSFWSLSITIYYIIHRWYRNTLYIIFIYYIHYTYKLMWLPDWLHRRRCNRLKATYYYCSWSPKELQQLQLPLFYF